MLVAHLQCVPFDGAHFNTPQHYGLFDVSFLPDTRFSGMSRIAAMARDAGLSGKGVFDHWSASETGLEARLEAAGAFTD